jgi:peroxiredoxin
MLHSDACAIWMYPRQSSCALSQTRDAKLILILPRRLIASSSGCVNMEPASPPRSQGTLPPFVLPDDSGRMVSLHELLTQGPVAVTFYRGHWCPYCRININALAQAHHEIAAEGGQIVAIMPDLRKFVAEFRSESKVPFPILTDMDNGYALSLNLTIWVGAELQKLMEARRNLPEFHGNSGCYLFQRPSWSDVMVVSALASWILTIENEWRSPTCLLH